MNTRVLVNGVEAARIAADDRGLLYGDGLFETLRVHRGGCPLWAYHLARLHRGCSVLGLPQPPPGLLERERDVLVGRTEDAVLRITWTRGPSARGYAPPGSAQPTRVLALGAPPAAPVHWYARGIRVRFCDLRLARQSRLAGIKHLNRLEQVLARAEWRDDAIVEGLMLDTSGRVIGATAANLFAVIDGELLTPRVDQSGIAGVGRALLMDTLPVRQRHLWPRDLARASELVLVSSVRGALPVRRLEATRWRPGPWVRRAQQVFAERGIGIPGGAAERAL